MAKAADRNTLTYAYAAHPYSNATVDVPVISLSSSVSRLSNDPWRVKDHPRRLRKERNPTGAMKFETCAICIKKTARRLYLDAQSWGFTYDGNPANDTLFGPTIQSDPSRQFLEILARDAPKYGASVCARRPLDPIPPID